MDDFLKKIAENFGYVTPFFYAAGTYKFFSWLDSEASDAVKTALATTMHLKTRSAKDVAFAVVEVFDWIYTHPLLSWRCLRRSILFSVVVTFVFAYEYLSLRSDLSRAFKGYIEQWPAPI